MPGGCDVVGAVPGLGGPAKAACNVVTNPVGAAGDAVSSAVGAAADSAFGKVAESTGQAAGDMLRTSMTWWVKSDSINLDPTAIVDVQRPLQGVFVLIMMAGILGTAIVMAMSRRGQPAAELLMGAFKYVAITSLSLVVLQGALSAGDDVAKQLVNNSDKFGDSLAQLIGIQTLTNPVMVFLLGVLCFLLALVQWIFGFIRQAGILVLASMIAFAAAGQLSSWGRQWFPRIASSIVALVLYKPMAAMIYSIGFKFMGTGKDLSTAVIGVMVIALAVIALPSMMKFFSFVGNGIGGGGGGGLALAAAGGASASRMMGGGGGGEAPAPQGDSSTSQAAYMNSSGPGTGQADPDPSPGSGGGGGGQAPGSDADGPGDSPGPDGGGAGGSASSGADVEGGESGEQSDAEHWGSFFDQAESERTGGEVAATGGGAGNPMQEAVNEAGSGADSGGSPDGGSPGGGGDVGAGGPDVAGAVGGGEGAAATGGGGEGADPASGGADVGAGGPDVAGAVGGGEASGWWCCGGGGPGRCGCRRGGDGDREDQRRGRFRLFHHDQRQRRRRRRDLWG